MTLEKIRKFILKFFCNFLNLFFKYRFADIFSKHMKLFLLVLNITSGVCFVWFTLLVNSFIPNSVGGYYMLLFDNMI